MVEIAGSPRVEGDEDEDDIDDLDNEFDYGNLDDFGPHHAAEGSYGSHLNSGRGSHPNASHIPGQSEHEPSPLGSEIPLLTYGEEVSGVLQHPPVLLVMKLLIFKPNPCNGFFSCARIMKFLPINMLLYPILWVMEIESIQCLPLIDQVLVSH